MVWRGREVEVEVEGFFDVVLGENLWKMIYRKVLEFIGELEEDRKREY